MPATVKPSERVKAYVRFRTVELEHLEAEAGQPGDLSMGSVIAKREAIVMARWTLRELSRLAEWLDAGEPAEFTAPLTRAEKEFWTKAKKMGVEVPPEIASQL